MESRAILSDQREHHIIRRDASKDECFDFSPPICKLIIKSDQEQCSEIIMLELVAEHCPKSCGICTELVSIPEPDSLGVSSDENSLTATSEPSAGPTGSFITSDHPLQNWTISYGNNSVGYEKEDTYNNAIGPISSIYSILPAKNVSADLSTRTSDYNIFGSLKNKTHAENILGISKSVQTENGQTGASVYPIVVPAIILAFFVGLFELYGLYFQRGVTKTREA